MKQPTEGRVWRVHPPTAPSAAETAIVDSGAGSHDDEGRSTAKPERMSR